MLRHSGVDMESLTACNRQPSGSHETSHNAFLDNLSWLAEDDDLDLRLTLDDHHADLKPPKPVTATGAPPLSRRRLSINKLSLGRSSATSSRPGTKDSFTEPAPITLHSRRKSRALSLITPRHSLQTSIISIDPAATHYQDPEARHKLRAYLASPQKFDEALEFGFPTNSPTVLSGDVPRRSRSFSRDLFMSSSEKLKTFLADDRSSIYSQETSIPDSESPRTPHTPDNHSHYIKPLHISGPSSTFSSTVSEACSQGPAASREMTLRMTLTRPDLRSGQEESHGNPPCLVLRQLSHSSQLRPFRVDSPVPAYEEIDATKESMDQIFADIDRELNSSPEGVVKRFWNRVRRG